jgi:fucose permease
VHIAARRRSGALLIIIAYLAFISLGLPDGLLGTAWPSIRSDFRQPLDALGGLLISFTLGYLLASSFSGWLLARMSVGTLLALSCAATATSLIGYTLVPLWPLVVALGFLLGAGGGALDAGLYVYATANFDARALNWLHACYGLGATAGPSLMVAVFAAGGSWRNGYLIVGGLQLALATCFVFTRQLWVQPTTAHDLPKPRSVSLAATLRRPVTWVSLATFFFYTGLEATAGQWAYSLLVEVRGVAPAAAGLWVSLYWGALTAGRVFFGLVAGRFTPKLLLRATMGGTVLGVVLLWFGGASPLSALGLVVLGFMLAPIFPVLTLETPERLGEEHTNNAVGLQIGVAVVGAAVLSSLVGVLSRSGGLEVLGPALFVFALLMIILHELALRLRG